MWKPSCGTGSGRRYRTWDYPKEVVWVRCTGIPANVNAARKVSRKCVFRLMMTSLLHNIRVEWMGKERSRTQKRKNCEPIRCFMCDRDDGSWALMRRSSTEWSDTRSTLQWHREHSQQTCELGGWKYSLSCVWIFYKLFSKDFGMEKFLQTVRNTRVTETSP